MEHFLSDVMNRRLNAKKLPAVQQSLRNKLAPNPNAVKLKKLKVAAKPRRLNVQNAVRLKAPKNAASEVNQLHQSNKEPLLL